MFLLTGVVRAALVAGALLHLNSHHLIEELVYRVIYLGAALLAGWICNCWLEGLPWRALGLGFHSGWFRDLLVGSVFGGGTLVLAALVAFVAGGLSFAFAGGALVASTVQSLCSTACLFIIAALFEEALFRGYPFQTLSRAGLVWLAILLTSVLFGIIHWQNPDATVFSSANTALAGVWLGVAYLRTRSLWFPLGVHWAWNWVQGSIIGSPVSGMVFSHHPVLQMSAKGPVWLTGGSYGLEGGCACTIALVLSILLIWRTKVVCATPEMKKLTSEENPLPRRRTVSE